MLRENTLPAPHPTKCKAKIKGVEKQERRGNRKSKGKEATTSPSTSLALCRVSTSSVTSWQLLGPAAPARCAETRWSAVYQPVLNTPCPGDPPGTLQSAAAHPGTAHPGSLWPGNLLSQQLRLLADSRQVPLQSHHTVQGKGLLQHRFLVLQDQALQAVEGCSAQSTLHVLGGDRPARAAWLSSQ